ncbi:MAG: FoF1 ATP synthase subunit delta/epsilon [Candidatus Gracilibacteria bacterium]
MSQFTLTIKTPDKTVFEGNAESISLKTETGQITILGHHADFLGSVAYTRIFVKNQDRSDEYIGRRGLVTFTNTTNNCEVLLIACEPIEEISHVSAAAYLAYVEEALRRGDDLSKSQLKFMEEERIMLVKQMQDIKE